MVRRAACLLLWIALSGCRTGRNYSSSTEPRYAGGPPEATAEGRAAPSALRLVSFNIEFALRVDTAIDVLRSDATLRDADVILLQEMNEAATRRIADALGLWYVYYPAIYHFRTRRDLGNAVLSRWPIVEDAKLLLPHVSRFGRTQRTATAATLRIGAARVRVYSTHLGTMADVGPGGRREQMEALLADADRYPCVVIGGDLNSPTVGRVVRERGYAWPTEHGPKTARLGRVDHIFTKGLAAPEGEASGTVLDAGQASDHRPVWALGILP